ncbi:Protein MNN4-like protein [Cladobotryum mycophilum]|uniref:Protein MNN4-like protein n=1 Tax=Cladobotryum mycophilum TaxID=491253 RepID=A0ABR0SJU6_9HYPO
MKFHIAIKLAAITWATLVPLSSAAAVKNKEPAVPKYFHEDKHNPHYDDRFAPHFYLTQDERWENVKILIQTYLSTCRDLGVQTWLMHGTLLGWWWGRKASFRETTLVMPWDLDADVQITEADMYFLAAYHNMTVHYYKYGNMEQGRYFQLEINPYFKHRDQDDRLNVIDARWIDMESGLFIDITAARYSLDHEEGEGILYDKFGHEYRDTYVFPLRDTVFEGVPAKIPFRYKDMLGAEYGRKALTNKEFHNHRFDEVAMQWVPMEEEEQTNL